MNDTPTQTVCCFSNVTAEFEARGSGFGVRDAQVTALCVSTCGTLYCLSDETDENKILYAAVLFN
jgi:hypothetical protein